MLFKPSLGSIAASHYSDKGLFGPSTRWHCHNYVDIYEAYLRDFVDDPFRLLEIGIGVSGENWDAKIVHGGNSEGGASLKMWQDYFPKAEIYALDINPASKFENVRVKTFVVDQGSRSELEDFKRQIGNIQFDLIIDDGSHRGDHQQISLELLWPILKSGGLYVIEDLNDRGYGERKVGRHVTKETVSTRNFFLSFAKTSNIIEPHAFENTNFLREIADIRFHSPKPVFDLRMLFRETVRTLLGRAKRGGSQTRFAKDSYKMVVLKKA